MTSVEQVYSIYTSIYSGFKMAPPREIWAQACASLRRGYRVDRESVKRRCPLSAWCLVFIGMRATICLYQRVKGQSFFDCVLAGTKQFGKKSSCKHVQKTTTARPTIIGRANPSVRIGDQSSMDSTLQTGPRPDPVCVHTPRDRGHLTL